MKINPINFCAKQSDNSFYSVNSKNWKIKKYDNFETASKENNSPVKNIKNAIKKASKSNGYFYMPAKYVEKHDENGAIILDKQKLVQGMLNTSKEVYVFKDDGESKKYQNLSQTSEELGIPAGYISRAIYSNPPRIKDMVFVYARDVEKADEKGDVFLDETGVNKSKKIDNHVVYAINPDGTYEKFPSATSASKDLNYNRTIIYTNLSSNNAFIRGRMFVHARDIEKLDEKGLPYVDMAKVLNFIKNASPYIYAINKNGEVTIYKNTVKAAEALGLSIGRLSNVLNNRTATKHYAFVTAREVLSLNENNEIVIDNQKVAQIIKERFKNENKYD